MTSFNRKKEDMKDNNVLISLGGARTYKKVLTRTPRVPVQAGCIIASYLLLYVLLSLEPPMLDDRHRAGCISAWCQVCEYYHGSLR